MANLLRAFRFTLCLCAAALSSAEEGPPRKIMPANFPQLTTDLGDYLMSTNGSGQESLFQKLWGANRELLIKADQYTPESVAVILGERMKHERNIHLKLVLASVAAAKGSEAAKDFILKCEEILDCATTKSRICALEDVAYKTKGAEWAIDALHRALTDQRAVKCDQGYSHHARVTAIASEESVTYTLADQRNPNSVPVLISLLKSTDHHSGALRALTAFADQRAVPALLEALRDEVKAIQSRKDGERSPSEDLTRALAKLKVRAAVPELLQYTNGTSMHVITALGEIGDERALPAIREIVEAEGVIAGQAEAWPGQFLRRRFAAKLALVQLEPEDRFPRLVELLREPSLEWTERSAVIHELGSSRDARAVPVLFEVLQREDKDWVVAASIRELGKFRNKTVVRALIDAMSPNSANRWPKHGGKGQMNSGRFLEEIGNALKEATGKNHGPTQAAWESWWNGTGRFQTESP
jgi:HEAT repeat protein